MDEENKPCDHDSNAMIKMPSIHGGANPDGCPFVWCRKCGAVWLPRLDVFSRTFADHEKQVGYAPINGVTMEGYWVIPGRRSLVMLPSLGRG